MIRTTRLIAACVAVCLGGVPLFAQDADLTWKRHTSDGGRFSVLLPGNPKTQTQQTDSPLGKLTVNSVMVEPTAKLAFLVSWNEYPATIRDDDPQDVLTRVRDGNNQFLKGELVVDRKTTFGKEKYPCRELEIRFPYMDDTMAYRATVVLVDTRLYQVVMIGTKESIRSDEAEDYFRSLKIKPVKKSEAID